VTYLTLPELLHAAERALGRDYEVRDYGLLEAALARPRATAFGKDAYPGLDAKAAALPHSIARNHALTDGDKRLAAVISFYGLNGRRPTLTNDQAITTATGHTSPGSSGPRASRRSPSGTWPTCGPSAEDSSSQG
jgi:death-on-curing protein